MNNIVSDFFKKNKDYKLKFNESLLKEEDEKNLYNFFESKRDEINQYISDSNYIDLFKLLIIGKPIIDKFFDNVLVMDKETGIRDNRLYILTGILGNFTELLDFSKIAEKGE